MAVKLLTAAHGHQHRYQGDDDFLFVGDDILVIVDPITPNDVRTSAKPAFDIPAGARIQSATFQITVDPPGEAEIADVAEVRKNPDPLFIGQSSFTIDFAGLRTVSELSLPALTEINTLHQWMGTSFATSAFYFLTVSQANVTTAPRATFNEVLTERIRMDLRDDLTVDDVLDGTVVIPTPPSSVEVLVNGTRAWFSVIDATSPTTLPDADSGHSLAVEIDLVDAFQAAIDADGFVELEVKTSGPCQMSVDATELSFLRTHPVVFPDGPNRTIEAPSEGTYVLDLPLDGSPGADDWEVRSVELRATAELEPPRVRPPVGPTLATDIDLVLTGERTLLVKLPASMLTGYQLLTGFRLPLQAGAGGGELSATMVADDPASSRPGEPIDGVDFTPLPVDETTEAVYVTLALAEPWEPEPGTAVWVSLRASRGELTWALAQPDDGAEPIETQIRWRAPGGTARLLPAVDDVADLGGAIRVVGEADPNQPIPALEVAVQGRQPTAAITPVAAGTDVTIELLSANQITPSEQAVSGVLRLALTVAAPGTYLFDTAVVAYRDPAKDGG